MNEVLMTEKEGVHQGAKKEKGQLEGAIKFSSTCSSTLIAEMENER